MIDIDWVEHSLSLWEFFIVCSNLSGYCLLNLLLTRCHYNNNEKYLWNCVLFCCILQFLDCFWPKWKWKWCFLATFDCVANDLLCLYSCCCCCCCCNPFACCKTNQRCCLLLWGTGSELQHRTMSCIQWQSQRKWNCKKSHSQQAVTAVENSERGEYKEWFVFTFLNIFRSL